VIDETSATILINVVTLYSRDMIRRSLWGSDGILKRTRDYINNETVDCSWIFAVNVCVARSLVLSGSIKEGQAFANLFDEVGWWSFPNSGMGADLRSEASECCWFWFQLQFSQILDIGGCDPITASMRLEDVNPGEPVLLGRTPVE
jgi:hypothetical protein